MEELEKDFKVEDIPEKGRKGENNVWREVAEKFPQGKEVLLYLAKNYGGERIYVQSYDTVMRPVRRRHYS